MSAVETLPAGPAPSATLRRDTLATSVMFLIGLSCIQPVVTLARGLLFCRWLEPVQMGCWDMVLSFITLAAPLVVFGIPGSFGRYVESYAQRGQLAIFLRRTTLVTLILLLVATALAAWGGAPLSWLIFSSTGYQHLIGSVALALATLIIFAFVVELLTALRMFRVASMLQVIKGVSFLMIGAALILGVSRGPASVIVAHSLACLVGAAAGGWWIFAAWKELPPAARPTDPGYISHGELWSRLMPFAIWMWVTNALSNVFEIVDRLMIVHCSRMTSLAALDAVGQYHSSRIVPMLFASFAMMLASLVLPHLSRDWEAGRRRAVNARVNLTLKLLSLALMVGSVALLWIAPGLFRLAFDGRYDGGLQVMPWTLVSCAWLGLSYVAVNYLLCAERVRLSTMALFAGLVANVLMNLALLPTLGLLGAVLATVVGKGVVLSLVFWYSRMLGMKIHRGTLLLAILPLSLAGGALVASAALLLVVLIALGTDQVFRAKERETLWNMVGPIARRVGLGGVVPVKVGGKGA